MDGEETYFVSFKQKLFLPHPRVKVSIVGSLRDREVACSASDRQGSNFESCVWRTVSSQSSHHPQEVLLAQFSLYVHKGGLKPDSFHYNHHPRAPARFKQMAINVFDHRVFDISQQSNPGSMLVYRLRRWPSIEPGVCLASMVGSITQQTQFVDTLLVYC